MASVQETLDQINSTLKDTKGYYSNYSCKTVSWDDVQRGTVGGSLSCWGANITDTRLYAKDGRKLFTVRGDNWNERLGKVTSSDLALVASHGAGGGAGSTDLKPITLSQMLTNVSQYGGYAGLNSIDSIADEELDKEVSVRFQTTFLPVDEGERSTLEFAPEAYNYNTTNDHDPRNLILLCTTQGVAVQQDGSGAKKLYHHAKVDEEIHRYWLEAESTNHKVGGSQQESKKEKEDAVKRGKATSSVIGVRGMGTRFNVLMTIQVPLEQQKKIPNRCSYAQYEDLDLDEEYEEAECEDDSDTGVESLNKLLFKCKSVKKAPGGKGGISRSFGRSSAARVSRGSLVDTWEGLSVKEPKRHPNEHVTATIVMYYTCAGGVPTKEDVKAAVDDLEEMYRSVENGQLANEKFDFMKSELTVKEMIDVKKKIENQPPPKPELPINANTFPE